LYAPFHSDDDQDDHDDDERHERRMLSMGTKSFYTNLEQARTVLAEMGIELSERQMRRAAETDAAGRRKLPFFVDPIEGTLKIEKRALVDANLKREVSALNNLRPG
jgi:hypothetical protein